MVITLVVLSIIILGCIIPPCFKCHSCRRWFFLKQFGFYSTLSGDTYCQGCYHHHRKTGGQDFELL